MIIETMNREEIANELLKDKRELYARIIAESRKNIYRKTMLKRGNNEMTYFPYIKIKSSNHNQYIVTPYSYGKKDYLKGGLCFCVYATYYIGNKLETIYVSMTTDFFVFITNHALNRYRERVLGNKDICIRDTVKAFIKKNSFMNFKPFESKKYPDSVFAVTSECVLFAIKDAPNIYTSITCVSFDMLRTSQLEMKEAQYKQLVEEMKWDRAC